MDAPRTPEEAPLTLDRLDAPLAEFRAVSTRTLALIFRLLEKQESHRAKACLWYIVEEMKRDVPGEAPRIMPYQDYRWITGALNLAVRDAKTENDPHAFLLERIVALRKECEVRFAPLLSRVETLLRIEEPADPAEEGGAPAARRRSQQRKTRTQLDELLDVMGIAYPYGVDLLSPELQDGRVRTLSAEEPIIVHCGNDDPQNVVEVFPKDDRTSQVLYVENMGGDLSAIALDFHEGETAVIGKRTGCDGIGNAQFGGTDLTVNLPAHGDTGDSKAFSAGNYLFVRVGGRIAMLTKRAKRAQIIQQGQTLYTYNPFAQRGGTYGRTARTAAPDEG